MNRLLAPLALLALAGCGEPPDGVYNGTLSGTTSSAFEAVFLEDGSVWVIDGQDLGSAFQVSGLWQGTGSAFKETYTSTNMKIFGTGSTGTFTADYSPTTPRTFSATLDVTSGNDVRLSGGTLGGTDYSYDSVALLSDITGTWDLTTVTINVTAGGVLTWNDRGVVGCSGNGTIVPRPSGKNVFDVSLTFDTGRGCTSPSQTVTGIGLSYPITSTSQRQLILALIDAARTTSYVQSGIR